ncbi:MAG: immunoglobulin domain-containing protein, partial [Terracidiphilus sp.]
MKVSTVLRIRVAFGVLATTLGLLVLSGCSGGWGENKPALTIQQGQSQTVTVGQSAIFTVTATGVGPFTYQWYLNGVAINSATSSSYNTGPTVISMNGSVYTVKVTNAAGNEMSAPLDLAVTPLVPTLTFSSIPAETYGNAPFPVTASSASSGAVTYALTAGQTSAGTVSSSGTVTITGAGTIYLTATQAANGNYAAATATTSFAVGNYAAATATTSFAVAAEVPTLTFSSIPAETYGNAPFPVTASSASSGAVTYALTAGQTSAGTVSSSGTVTITGAGTIYLTATQAASGNYAAATATTSFAVAA